MICPNCQVEQNISEQNYGALYTCSSCQAVYFINFEGQPEYGDVPVEAPIEASVEPSSDSSAEVPFADDQLLNEQLNTNEFQNYNGEVSSTQYNIEPNVSLDEMYLQNPFEVKSATNDGGFADVAKDISDFGNNESQLAALNYDLDLSAIDTKELVKQLTEAIEDSKFGWDVKDIISSIKNGNLSIKSISPVKAYLLAKRIRFLDIEKKWKQNVLQ